MRFSTNVTIHSGDNDVHLPKPLASTTPPAHLREIGPILKLASLISRYVPRGKGAIPRCLGRVFMKPGKVYFVTKHGARMVVDPGCLDVFATMRGTGAFDYEDFMICRDLMPESGTFYDIGANVGYFSIEMLAVSHGTVSVVSFEPLTDLAKALRLSADICQFPNIQVFNTMVGDHSGTAEFYVTPASVHGSAVSDLGRSIVRTALKPMVAIDDLVDANEVPPPDVVKADIEGSEHLMFAGAARTFVKHAPHIFIEYHAYEDPGLRIRNQVGLLTSKVTSYAIFGCPRNNLKDRFPSKLFEIKNQSDWDMVHSVVLRNRDRAVRNEGMFGPPRLASATDT